MSVERDFLEENCLRTALLSRIGRVEDQVKVAIVQEFQRIGVQEDEQAIFNYFSRAVDEAQLVGRWRGAVESGRVGIGYYQTAAQYYSYLLHEVGHNILDQVEASGGTKITDNKLEEDFCWRFSRLSCSALGLPYDERVEEINRRFFFLAFIRGGGELTEEFFDEIVEEEMKLTGFSPFVFAVRYSDGIPQKVLLER